MSPIPDFYLRSSRSLHAPHERSGKSVKRGARAPSRPTLVDRLRAQKLPTKFETGSGFAVEGADIRCLWTPSRVVAEPHGDSNWWRVGEELADRLQNPVPTVIEFADGRCAALAAIPGFIGGLVCDTRTARATRTRLCARTRYTHDEDPASTC
jgi:hypothetical protein